MASRPHTRTQTPTSTPGMMVVVVIVVVASLVLAVASPADASAFVQDPTVTGGVDLLTSVSLLDLTYTINVDVPASHQVRVVESDQHQINVKIMMNDMCGDQLLGTHVDAPAHFSNTSWTVEDIPLYRLWNVPAVVIDMEPTVRMSGNRTYAITARDLERALSKHQEFLPHAGVVLLNTGWNKKSHNLRDYLGYDENETNHFPGLSEDGAQWLANYGYRRHPRTGVVGVGIDTPSVDVGDSLVNPARTVLHANNIYSIHNLKNLDKLPSSGFRVTVMPLKIGGGSAAAPARVLATKVNETALTSENRSQHHHHHSSSREEESSEEDNDFGGDTHDGWPYDKLFPYGDVNFVDRDGMVLMASSATVLVHASFLLPLLLTATVAMWI
ncbi:uncharacterized protein [Panulirus ornatus]|uniref:uncharacterized protein n=1 Tax=Panulirus ornatus TaxID=150431 RepID=UPI003A87B435